MSRCNAYAQVTTENRSVGIGGRGAQDWVRVRINTDNAKQNDCALQVLAEVKGPGLRSKERRKEGSDERESVFDISFPEAPHGWRAILCLSSESADSVRWNGVTLADLWAAYSKSKKGKEDK